MKKNAATKVDLRSEYDFTHSRSNKYSRLFANGTNVVLIDEDLSKLFPNSKTVNQALRAIVSIFQISKRSQKRRRVK